MLEHCIQTRETIRHRVAELEHRITVAYDSLVINCLTTTETRIDRAEQAVVHAAETDAVTTRAARGQVRGLETRIDTAYNAQINRELDGPDSRIDDAYREVETTAQIEAGRSGTCRLKIAIAVLLAVLGLLLLVLAVTIL